MDIACIARLSEQELKEFVDALNVSFRQRSEADSRIPYRPLSLAELQKENPFLLRFFADDKLAAGLALSVRQENGHKFAALSHLFTLPCCRGKGYATKLMVSAEQFADEQGCSYFVSM